VAQVINPAAVLMEPAFHAKEIALTVVIPEHLPLVWADVEKMHQVLVNLLANALAATPAQGTVTISVECRPVSPDELERGRRVAEAMSPLVVAIAVQDTGLGMPEADVQKAFEPFFTTKAVGKGTGLGLFLSRETVVAHGGELSIKSEMGRGTTVTMTLPGLQTKPVVA
jgi:signal transduction histidine kinase